MFLLARPSTPAARKPLITVPADAEDCPDTPVPLVESPRTPKPAPELIANTPLFGPLVKPSTPFPWEPALPPPRPCTPGAVPPPNPCTPTPPPGDPPPWPKTPVPAPPPPVPRTPAPPRAAGAEGLPPNPCTPSPPSDDEPLKSVL